MILLASFNEFIGSVHPLIVHLPIGFLIAAILGEGIKRAKPSMPLSTALKMLWPVTAVSAVLAAICGLTLAGSGHYIGDGLFIHKWTGIGLAVGCSIISFHYLGLINLKKYMSWSIGLIAVILIVCGHYGGEMTHGPQYLQKNLPFKSSVQNSSPIVVDMGNADTIFLFEDLIQPVFEKKCIACHNQELSQGNYDMTSYEGLLDNTFGDNITKGEPLKSNMMKRVMYDPDNKKFMPPMGTPLTYFEKRLLHLWIQNGANQGQNMKEMNPSEDFKALMKYFYNIDFKKKSFYEKIKIDPLGEEIYTFLKEAKFNVRRLAADNYLLDVTRTGQPKEITSDDLNALLKAAEHVTWLDLAGTDITNEHLEIIGKLSNLTRLKLQNTAITDEGLTHLTGLKHLASLNIYGTSISNASIDQLSKLKSLTNLYIWQTEIDQANADLLQSRLTGLEIISGVE